MATNKRTAAAALKDRSRLIVSGHPYRQANGTYKQMEGLINGTVWYQKKEEEEKKKKAQKMYFWFYDKKDSKALDSWNFR